MCSDCRKNAELILGIILPTVATTLAAHNAKAVAGNPKLEANPVAEAEQAAAFDLLGWIARTSRPETSEYHSADEAMNAITDRLRANPETRANIRQLVIIAKFGLYAAQLFERWSALAFSNIEIRARDEADPEAVKFALGDLRDDLHEVMERAGEQVDEELSEMGSRRLAAVTEHLSHLSDHLRAEREGRGVGRTPASTPDYRH